MLVETIIIGKPAINIYLPLQEFPQEGDIFTIKGKNESVGNIGATSACLLSKWGIPVHFTGVVGNDGYAEKIRNTFKDYKVNARFLETNFEKGTSINYNILNVKNGIVSKILYNDPDNQLTKYKYDFVPGFAIIDGTDFAGAHALLNNNANCKTMFYARFGDKDTIALSKRCNWVICTQTFAEMMTKLECDGTAETYVNLYQKIVDISGKSNYIVILNNHKILYSVDGKVKMLPEMKINVADYSSFDSIFVGTLAFAFINNVSLDDAIKLANTASAISISRIGEVAAIPDLDEVLENSGLKEKLGLSKKENPTPIATPQSIEPLNPSIMNSQPSVETMNNQGVEDKAFNSTPIENLNTQDQVQNQVVNTPEVTSSQTTITPPQLPQNQETGMFNNTNV